LPQLSYINESAQKQYSTYILTHNNYIATIIIIIIMASNIVHSIECHFCKNLTELKHSIHPAANQIESKKAKLKAKELTDINY